MKIKESYEFNVLRTMRRAPTDEPIDYRARSHGPGWGDYQPSDSDLPLRDLPFVC
jgi:hypothetical protein